MKMAPAQLVFLILGVLLISLGGGLAGGRIVAERSETSPLDSSYKPPKDLTAPSSEQFPDESSPLFPFKDKAKTAEPALPDSTSPPTTEKTKDGSTETGSIKTFVEPIPRFVIQAVSTSSREDARVARRKIMAAGFPAGVFEVDLGERGRWYRVYIGPYDREDEASEILNAVRAVPGFKESFLKPLE